MSEVDAANCKYHVLEWDYYDGQTINPRIILSTNDFAEAFKEFDKFLPIRTARRIVKPTRGKIVEETSDD